MKGSGWPSEGGDGAVGCAVRVYVSGDEWK